MVVQYVALYLVKTGLKQGAVLRPKGETGLPLLCGVYCLCGEMLPVTQAYASAALGKGIGVAHAGNADEQKQQHRQPDDGPPHCATLTEAPGLTARSEEEITLPPIVPSTAAY